MRRRDFLAAAAFPCLGLAQPAAAFEDGCGTFGSPAEAMKAPRETLAFVTATYAGTKVKKPDYLAVVDLDPTSSTYARVIARLELPNVGDELHHFGWNACGSCHGRRERSHLIVPGLVSGRIHVVDVRIPRQPKLVKVIEPEEVVRRTKLTAPHTVHCLPSGEVMLSMLGNEKGEGPGGFLLLDEKFDIAGVWERGTEGMRYNYDFWYQPRRNVMVSSEWAAPNTTRPGFKLEDVKAGKYGQHLHFWDWKKRTLLQSVDLGEEGLIPLEVRFHHRPESDQGFVGAALSSTIWRWRQGVNGRWEAERIIAVEPKEVKGWPFPVPGLITDLVLSLDDRWLYFANWLHGDIRQYDVSDPAKPRLAGQLWLGGVLGKTPSVRGAKLEGGPQMLQLSLDGKRLYVTNSLFSSWDNQFYPAIGERGSYLLQAICDTQSGGLALNEKFVLDFGAEPHGPSRAHEVRFPQGDCTSDIWT